MKKHIDLEEAMAILSILLMPILLPIMVVIEFFKAQISFIKECCQITYDFFYQIYWDIKHWKNK